MLCVCDHTISVLRVVDCAVSQIACAWASDARDSSYAIKALIFFAFVSMHISRAASSLSFIRFYPFKSSAVLVSYSSGSQVL